MNNKAQDNAVPLRTRLKQLRAQQDPAQRDRGALLIRGRLYTWLASERTRLRAAGRKTPYQIAAFWSLPEEPGLQALLRQWVEDEALGVSLPVVTGPNEPLGFRQWTPNTPMHEGAYGVQEPESAPAPPPDIVLVPTLGYTRQGDRLGYGGGYYDRTLAAWQAAGHPFTSLGIAWACGDLSDESYTPAAHDVRLDSILTDKGWAVPAPVL
ncbi:5-formyltetrahydrofolate cyclo-ligase [Alcaligenaceae bacterium CGII-47]|nr:5-formyltetrahydrofolate cyclo-ligase [Alcaligenaceae bacterium CGII-47]